MFGGQVLEEVEEWCGGRGRGAGGLWEEDVGEWGGEGESGREDEGRGGL